MKPQTRSLPTGVLLLAVVGVVLGAPGTLFGVIDLLSSSAEPDLVQTIDQLEQSLPEPYRTQLLFMRRDPKVMQNLVELGAASQRIIPAPRLLTAANLLLSIWCLAAGVGLLWRREWGRKAEIGLLVAGTLFLFGSGYLVIPGLLDFAALLEQSFGPGVVPASAGRVVYIGWSALFALFAGLHGAIVVYLLRPRIRASFA